MVAVLCDRKMERSSTLQEQYCYLSLRSSWELDCMPGFIGTDVIDRSSFYLLVDNKRIIGNVTIYIFSAVVENSYVSVILIAENKKVI